MRKIITLAGVILIVLGIWGWNAFNLFGGDIYAIFFFSFIAGIIITIAGIVMHPRELKEPFKSIAEKFEKLNKPVLVASILIFFASLWFFLYGFYGILYFHEMELFLNIPLDNASINTTIASSLLHNYNETILILSYTEIFAGAIYVAIGINAMEKKHLAFIVSSLIFGSVLSVLFRFYLNTSFNAWNTGATAGISIAYDSTSYSILPLIPLVFSIVALLLLLWQYKEYE
ncbi:MAG: hypothetical protein J7K95_02480 [Thermoplasmata archaeon]|nr:hypothetical protein [Thermoplasmata archaeon]